MKSTRFLRIGAAVVGAVLVAGVAIVITASAAGLRLSTVAATASPAPKSSPSPGGGRSKADAVCQDYLAHLASHLKVSQSTLDAAAAAAAKDTIQDQVTSGALTQDQANQLEAKLGSGSVCSAAINGLAKAHGGAPKAGGEAMSAYLSAAAGALGIAEAQLKMDLKNGQSLSQVAAAQNLSEDDFKAKVSAALKPKLDAAVAAGKLTQAQEDAALAKLQQGDPPLWSSAHK